MAKRRRRHIIKAKVYFWPQPYLHLRTGHWSPVGLWMVEAHTTDVGWVMVHSATTWREAFDWAFKTVQRGNFT
jgi:hypothetical protein